MLGESSSEVQMERANEVLIFASRCCCTVASDSRSRERVVIRISNSIIAAGKTWQDLARLWCEADIQVAIFHFYFHVYASETSTRAFPEHFREIYNKHRAPKFSKQVPNARILRCVGKVQLRCIRYAIFVLTPWSYGRDHEH